MPASFAFKTQIKGILACNYISYYHNLIWPFMYPSFSSQMAFLLRLPWGFLGFDKNKTKQNKTGEFPHLSSGANHYVRMPGLLVYSVDGACFRMIQAALLGGSLGGGACVQQILLQCWQGLQGQNNGKQGGFPAHEQEEGSMCKVFLNRRKMDFTEGTWSEQNLEGMVPQVERERHFRQRLQ